MRHLSLKKHFPLAPPYESRGLKKGLFYLCRDALLCVFRFLPSFSSEAKNMVKIYSTIGIEFTPPQTPPLEGRGLKIDISNLPAGVYFIKIGDKFKKFVKL
jgi:hypothetical protein